MTAQTRPAPRPPEALSPADPPRVETARAEAKPAAAAAEAVPSTRRSLFRRLRPLLLALLLLGGAVGGAWWWTVARFLESTNNAYVQGDIAVASATAVCMVVPQAGR